MSVLNEKCPDFAKIFIMIRTYKEMNNYTKIIFLSHVSSKIYCGEH